MVWWWQGPELTRILVFHDMVHGHACFLRLLLCLPLQFHLDRRRALVRVVLGINSMEPAEKPLTTGPLLLVMLLWLRPPIMLVSALVPAAPVLVLVGARGHVVDLTVRLLRRLVLPPLRLVPLPLLFLLLCCICPIEPSEAAFVRLAVFLHNFK
jgi:hypothetical protein